MSQNVTLYNLLISCPGDVKDEVTLIESAVNEFNELYAEPLGITITPRHWSKSAYAQSGGKPQSLLNEQFVNKCDAAVAIFWTKFGSPTDEYSSGTEEEIENMLKSGKQVFMYFSDKPLSPSQMNDDGYKKILAFREKYKERGLYFTYSSNEEFKKLFFAHLSMYFLHDKKDKETAIERAPKLKLMGIDKDGNLSDKFSVYPFVLNTENTMNQYIDVIRTMYQEISEMNVGSRDLASNPHFISLERPVEIDKAERNLIAELAKKLELELSDNFFDLGNLNKDSFVSDPFSGPTLRGKPEEIQKYEKIKELHDMISKAIEWAPVEQAFSDKYCLRLAVQNCGRAIDEDVEITFEIPQESLLSLTEFPHFKNDEMKYLLNDCNMYELFGINSTYEYIDYSDSSKNGGNPVPYPAPTALLGYTPDYKEAFDDTLKNIFCYSVYPKKEIYIVKLKLDYIKHNTTVAFPSVLFVKRQFQKITYKITSKNNPEVFEGVLMVQT